MAGIEAVATRPGDEGVGSATRAEEDADASLAVAGSLSEAALRDAQGLRHVSTNPQTLALICQTAETMLLALALWGCLPPSGGGFVAVVTAMVALALAVGATTAGRIAGAYRVEALRRFADGFLRMTAAASVFGAAVWTASEALGASSGSAGIDFDALGGAALLALFAARVVIAPAIDWCVAAGLIERRVVIVGGGPNAEALVRGLERQPGSDMRVVAVFDDRDDERSPPLVAGARKLGGIAELLAFCRIAHVDMAIVTLPLTARARIERLLEQLWVLPIDIRLSSYAEDYSFRRRAARPERPGQLIEVASQPFHGVGGLLKRVMDLAIAVPMLIALSPVMLATTLAIVIESRGPVFFRQRRDGYNDQVAHVWKFRSMYADQTDHEARRVVSRGDPRVTRVGRFIRRTSIDELPQLFNVLSGEMSLVGPRPHAVNALASDAQRFASIVSGYSARHRVKPGITGLAQINGCRGEIDDPDKLRRRFEYDLQYIENWSLMGDLRILLRTPLSLLNTENAY
jgi:Undecaprenyl-phosphate glucose phosphotransferase